MRESRAPRTARSPSTSTRSCGGSCGSTPRSRWARSPVPNSCSMPPETPRERILTLDHEVDVAFGPGSIAHLGEWLGAGGVGIARGRFGLDERAFAAELPMHRERSFRGWVQVSMGCNSKCAYCIVPAV